MKNSNDLTSSIVCVLIVFVESSSKITSIFVIGIPVSVVLGIVLLIIW